MKVRKYAVRMLTLTGLVLPVLVWPARAERRCGIRPTILQGPESCLAAGDRC
jgi:hypothetical protein